MFTPPQLEQVRKMIESNEGRRSHPYVDTTGRTTIGVGRNLTDNGLTEAEVDLLFDHDINDALFYLNNYRWFSDLAPVRQMACVDMMFNLGPTHFEKFVVMLAALAVDDWEGAADAILDSTWAKQVTSRAYRAARMMRTGVIK